MGDQRQNSNYDCVETPSKYLSTLFDYRKKNLI